MANNEKDLNNCRICTLLSLHLKKTYEGCSKVKSGGAGSRLKSWECCHSAFLEKKDKNLTDEDIDSLALNLAFYLASWGMYRGSSFLLDRDYKAHRKVVSICMERQYALLWDYEPNPYNLRIAATLLFGDGSKENDLGLVSRIRKAYGQEDVKASSEDSIMDDLEEEGSRSSADNAGVPTETLITKILLGVFACIPAFDRYFSEAYKCLCVSEGKKGLLKLDRNTFLSIGALAIDHRSCLWYYCQDVFYPAMKCLDLALWRMGLCDEIVKTLENPSKDAKAKKDPKKMWGRLRKLDYCGKEDSCDTATLIQIRKEYLPEKENKK